MFPERETAFQQRPGLVKKERGSDPVWPKPLQVGRNRSLVPSPPQSDRAGVHLNPHGGYLTVQRTVCDRKSKLCTQWTPRRLMAARGKEAFRCCIPRLRRASQALIFRPRLGVRSEINLTRFSPKEHHTAAEDRVVQIKVFHLTGL